MWMFSILFGIVAAVFLRSNVIAPTQITINSDLDSLSGSQTWMHPSSSTRYIDVRAFGLCFGQTLYSGYYHDTDSDVHLFFVYARASENPETSPLAIWTNGGPGTSGVSLAFSPATGCMLETTANGMRLSYKSVNNMRRWNEKVNVIFLEQPIGTGFSYGSGPSAMDTRSGAEDIYHFIQIILSRHPHIPSVSFHSLSYGGHFVPEWSNKVIEENARIRSGEVNGHIIPLNRVTMGNAWFGNDEQYLSLFDTLCEDQPYLGGPPDPLLPPSEWSRVYANRETCANLLRQCRKSTQQTCGAAHLWCWTAVRHHFKLAGRAMFDLSAVSDEIEAYDTYPELTKFLNLRSVQVALGIIGVNEPRPRKWEYFNQSVSVLHLLVGDHARPTDILLPKLVAAGIDVLLYVGTLDLSCNFRAARKLVASHRLVEKDIPDEFVEWSQGKGRFICSTQKRSGIGKFCYLEIDGAAHGLAYEYEGWGDVLQKWILEGSL
jgi:cathepsin A (carboxypeptidase C)